MRARSSADQSSGCCPQNPIVPGLSDGVTTVMVVAAVAFTGGYVHPLASVNVSGALLVKVVPPSASSVGRAVNWIELEPEFAATAPTFQVSVRVPLPFNTTEFGFGPAPRSSAVL